MKDQDQIQHEECVFRPHEYRSKGQPVESACDHLEAYLESKADLFVKGIDFRQKAPTDDDSFIRLAFQSLAASSSCSSSGALNLLHQQMKDKIAALSPNKEPKETAVVVPNSISPDKQQPIEVHDHQFTIELQHQHFILQLQQKVRRQCTTECASRGLIIILLVYPRAFGPSHDRRNGRLATFFSGMGSQYSTVAHGRASRYEYTRHMEDHNVSSSTVKCPSET